MSVINLDSKNFEEEVLNSEVPVLIDFWATWCGPCRMMAPVVEEIANEVGEKAKVCKVNIDENKDIAEKYDVMSIPTFLIIKNGKVAATTVGVQPKENIIKCEGYSAEELCNTTILKPLGAYNYLIYLRDNPEEALANLKAGLPIK